MNGNNPVSPFKRQYLSTGVSLAVIICYRIGEALYNFLTSYVLDGFAYLFNALLGITSDLWHSNPSYSRWASKGALSALTTIGISTVVAGKMIGSGLLVLIR